jgi:hypothetical protein
MASVVAQVDKFDAEIGAPSRNIVKPRGRALAEAALPRRADDNADM